MVRLIVAIAVVLGLAAIAEGKPKPFIEITLETQEAFLGDTIIVEVRWSGLLDPIDFTPLSQNAELQRETAGTRIAVVEGQVIEIASRRIELLPRVLGRLRLGPLRSGDIVSNVVTIDIAEPRTIVWTPGSQDIRLDQTVSEESPFVQQEVRLDIVLRTRHPIFGEAIVLPKLDGFRAVTIFAERRTLDDGDGGWASTAWRYLLYPQRSGMLVIPGARVGGTVAKSRAERAQFDIAAADNRLDIRPSAFSADAWWIAARGVRLAEAWSRAPTGLVAGDEVERTITVTADGVMPEQIPDVVMPETRGLAVTPAGADRTFAIVGESVRSTATFRFRIRAMSPVPVFLDTVRLRWWDTMAGKPDDAIVPARRIDVGIPDRASLVEHASAEGWWERIGDAVPHADSRSALLGLALAALAALVATMSIWPHLRLSEKRARRREARRIASIVRRGDAAGLHRRLRALAGAGGPVSLRPIIMNLEETMFAGQSAGAGAGDLAAIGRAATAALSRADGSGRRTTLPSL